jgi:hypothetical protein
LHKISNFYIVMKMINASWRKNQVCHSKTTMSWTILWWPLKVLTYFAKLYFVMKLNRS